MPEAGAVEAQDRQTEVVTVPRWFGPAERPLLGWLTHAPEGPTSSGVLMLAPVAYDWWTTHRTLRTVAERLATAGHAVLRFDYDGTGDSAGSGFEPDRVEAWRAAAAVAAAELRGLGCRRLTLLGSRFGGLLAVLDGAALEADAVVAWAPPASGKRFARELRMLSQAVPGEEEAVAVSGMTFSAATLAAIGALDPRHLEAKPAPRVALVGSGLGPLAERLRELGSEVEEADPPGAETALGVTTEEATVPEAVVDALVAAVGPADPERLPAPGERAEASFDWNGDPIRERVVRIGPDDLVGVLTMPAAGPGRAIVVWLNSGSEPHVGPGRAWVEYARALARRDQASLRLDYSGWGESPDRGHAPGRPYDPHVIEETLVAVAALRELGYERIVLAGLCAGAWIALKAMLEVPLGGVIALNAQMWWQYGDPVEALIKDTRIRRTAEREREERGARNGLWSLLDRLGRRPPAGRWLDAVAATEVPTLLCFAEGDEGLVHLENRLARRLAVVTAAGSVEVAEVPDIDHSMHRAWLRDRIIAVVDDFLERLP